MNYTREHICPSLFSDKYNFRDDCNEVSFRMDFYSKKDFIEKFQNRADGLWEMFCERVLSPEESQRIELESVSASLGNSVNEISERKAFIFFWKSDLKDPNNICQVFVSPYFLYVYCKGNNINLLRDRLDCLTKIIESIKDQISPIGVRLVSNYVFMLGIDSLPVFGMRYFNVPFNEGIIQNGHVKFLDENEITNIDSEMDIAQISKSELIATIKIKSSVYAPIMSIENENLMASLSLLVDKTEKYMTLCAE